MSKIWSVVYSDSGKNHMVTNLSKAEAKTVWKAIMKTFGTNLNRSAHCSEAYLQRNGKIVFLKNGDYWFQNGELVAANQIWLPEAIDEAVASI